MDREWVRDVIRGGNVRALAAVWGDWGRGVLPLTAMHWVDRLCTQNDFHMRTVEWFMSKVYPPLKMGHLVQLARCSGDPSLIPYLKASLEPRCCFRTEVVSDFRGTGCLELLEFAIRNSKVGRDDLAAILDKAKRMGYDSDEMDRLSRLSGTDIRYFQNAHPKG